MKTSKKMLLVLLAILLMAGPVQAAEYDGIERIKTDKEAIRNYYRLASGDKKPVFKADFEFLQAGFRVVEVSEDYLWAIGGNPKDGYARVVYKSSDLGDSWQKVGSFKNPIEAIHLTSRGVILVSTSKGRWLKDAQGEIFASHDQGQTFKKVLDIKSGAAIPWNFASDDEGYIFISEYGYKQAPDNARRIYRSKDDGHSWSVVYNPKSKDMHHNHVIQIDRDNKNIIYQSIGDRYKEIIRSTDRGQSWQRIIYDYNPTAMLQIDDNILFGLDNHPKSGIIRYNKKTGKLDFAMESKKPFNGSIYDLLYDQGVVYAGLLSYSQPSHHWDGSMFISRDKGKSWENFAVWPKLNEKSGVGFYDMLSKDGYGFINGQFPVMIDGKPGHFVGTLKFKLIENH